MGRIITAPLSWLGERVLVTDALAGDWELVGFVMRQNIGAVPQNCNADMQTAMPK